MWGERLTDYIFFFFFFNVTATTEIYTLSLHDALPISAFDVVLRFGARARHNAEAFQSARRPLGRRSSDLGRSQFMCGSCDCV